MQRKRKSLSACLLSYDLAHEGCSLLTLKRHCDWQSDSVAEDYIQESKQLKLDVSTTLLGSPAPSVPSPPNVHLHPGGNFSPGRGTFHFSGTVNSVVIYNGVSEQK